MNHTPTPWKVFRTNMGNVAAIETSNPGEIVAGLVRGEDAAFIVLACNYHERLVEILENTRYVIEVDHPGSALAISRLLSEIEEASK